MQEKQEKRILITCDLDGRYIRSQTYSEAMFGDVYKDTIYLRFGNPILGTVDKFIIFARYSAELFGEGMFDDVQDLTVLEDDEFFQASLVWNNPMSIECCREMQKELHKAHESWQKNMDSIYEVIIRY